MVNGMERLMEQSNGIGFDSKLDLTGLRIGFPIEYEQELVNNINGRTKGSKKF